MPFIQIPAPLRRFTENKDSIEVYGNTIREALDSLLNKYSELKVHLYNEKGEIRHFVNIYLNEEDIRYLKNLETEVKSNDVISIIPAIAGGNIELNYEEIKRYSRHLIIPEVGIEGQKKLKEAKVIIIGMGGLGTPLALYLAAAGVGKIGLVDMDKVDKTNLQRQVIYNEKEIGKEKVFIAKEKLQALNPHIEIDVYSIKLTSENALDILKNYDIVADGTDNFPTRYLVNDACVLLNKINVYASIFRFEGQLSVFNYKGGPCYRCLYPEPPPPGLVPSCAEGGVLGVLPGIIGSLQAAEVLKILLNIGEPLSGRLLLYDALKQNFRELKLRKNENCPICSENRTINSLIDYEEFCGLSNLNIDSSLEITVEELREKINKSNIILLDVREKAEYNICHLPNAKLIPLSELRFRVNELDTADEIIAYCHKGSRSAQAVRFLREIGFNKVKSLKGGIDEWAENIEPNMPRY